MNKPPTHFYLVQPDYRPHFNCVPQLSHVLQPPISFTFPFRQTGQMSPISEPMVTSVERRSCIVSTSITFGDSFVSGTVVSSCLLSSAFNVKTCVSRLPST